MAYLARIEPLHSLPVAAPAMTFEVTPKPDFSALEWSVIRLARVDGLSTIREPGPFKRAFNWLIGRTGSPRLANERLEALRRIAVLSWHFGFSVPGEDVADFLSAGFTPDQYELVVESTRVSAPPARTAPREAFA
jgi:hypothetical protein